MSAAPHPDPLVEDILEVFAREARIERHRLQLDARIDELGLASLDMALALFELEDRHDIQLPLPEARSGPLTVGDVVLQLRDCILARRGALMPGMTGMPGVAAVAAARAATSTASTATSQQQPRGLPS